MSSCEWMLRTPLGATSTRSTRISSRLISTALLIPVPDVAAIGLSTSAPAVPGVCATADPIQSTATTIADASFVLSMVTSLLIFYFLEPQLRRSRASLHDAKVALHTFGADLIWMRAV